jgi:hypothetical protein
MGSSKNKMELSLLPPPSDFPPPPSPPHCSSHCLQLFPLPGWILTPPQGGGGEGGSLTDFQVKSDLQKISIKGMFIKKSHECCV